MIDFLINNPVYISALIAFIALIRPEISRFFKFVFNKIEFYSSRTIEIGFFDLGPTIGLDGTLQASISNQFIIDMKVILQRQSDHKTHIFDWHVFRDLDVLNPQNSKFRQTSAFMVQAAEPKKINMLFTDDATKQRFMNPVMGVQNAFKNYLKELKDAGKDDNIEIAAEDFRKQGTLFSDVWVTIGKAFYWEAGSYIICLKMKTSHPSKTFESFYEFTLSEEEVEKLELNKVGLLEAAIYRNTAPNFLNVPLIKTIKRFTT